MTRRTGDFLKLQDADGTEREANIRDVVIIREAPQSVTETEAYQLLHMLLHGEDKQPREAGELPRLEYPHRHHPPAALYLSYSVGQFKDLY